LPTKCNNAPSISTKKRFHLLKVKIKHQIFNNLEIYPNPASSLVNITYDMPVNAEVHYQLLSLSGQLLFTGKLNGLKGTCPIDVSDLAQGIYLLQFTNDQEEKFTHKIQLIK
jgi:hypothetical protein